MEVWTRACVWLWRTVLLRPGIHLVGGTRRMGSHLHERYRASSIRLPGGALSPVLREVGIVRPSPAVGEAMTGAVSWCRLSSERIMSRRLLHLPLLLLT